MDCVDELELLWNSVKQGDLFHNWASNQVVMHFLFELIGY